MGLRLVRCRYVIILEINTSDDHELRNHSYDYRPNRTPLSAITIINNSKRIFDAQNGFQELLFDFNRAQAQVFCNVD